MHFIKSHVYLLILLLLALLVFFKLGENHLANWDEAWYADITRTAYLSGNYFKPIWNTQIFFDKPPLSLWLSIIFLNIFGISEFSYRFISALSAIGTGLMIYLLGLKLFNKTVGLLSLIILSSSIGFLYRARTGNVDLLLTFWLTFIIYAFYRAYAEKQLKWFCVLSLAISFGFLAKGFIAFSFPIIAVLYLFFANQFRFSNLKYLLYSIFLGLLIPALWVIVNMIVYGDDFVAGFFFNQTGKISTDLKFWQNFSLDYFMFLKSGMKFWFIIFIAALPYFIYKSLKNSKLILALYLIAFILILSFAENKSNWFLVPFYPITALFSAYFIYELSKKISLKSPYLIIGILILALVQIYLYKNEYITPDIAKSEAQVALAANRLTNNNVVLYLTNYYCPTTVYYSQRKTYAVYSDNSKNNAWWIKPKAQWSRILQDKDIFIITTDQELFSLSDYFSKYTFKELYRNGDKILIKKI